jgi:outer membrane lipopolysaccharide assembly protein LptE/RlpB
LGWGIHTEKAKRNLAAVRLIFVPPLRKFAVVREVALLAIAAALAGCGYHTVGASSEHLPASVRVIAVPIFANNTQSPRVEIVMTNAITRELVARTGAEVVPTAGPNADAVLKGTILGEAVVPLVYNSTSGTTESYLLTITAKAVLTDRGGHVLYENDNYTFRQQYESTQQLPSFIEEGSPAVDRLSRDFAQSMVSDMLESF